MEQRVFITGGTGFIGSYVVRLLGQQGFDCYVLTRQDRVDKENLHYLPGNMMDMACVQSYLHDIRPQVLVHLAWGVNSAGYAEDVHNSRWMQCSEDLLQAFLECGGRTVLSSGTCYEYNLDLPNPHREVETGEPLTMYGKSKLQTYRRFKSMCEHSGARLAWGRIFYAYGPGEPKRKIFTQAIKSLMTGKSFVCQNPDNWLDYIYVEDVARILVALLVSGRAEGIFNLGTGQAIQLRTALVSLAKAMHREGQVDFGNGVTHDAVADMSKTQQYYREDFTPLRQGLHRLASVLQRQYMVNSDGEVGI
ncbi:MAG: NAD-dependent epimerase/dehydratase family protein [Selenomonadaceae bacterium]|nr:NAD-dependent epimerase/dehydratase family protein [Selenomonadaceae bacterium]